MKTTMNTEIATLVVLYHDEEVSQAELAKIVKRSQPTISNAVKKLDAEGFIHKSGKALFITSLGRKRVETVSAVFAA